MYSFSADPDFRCPKQQAWLRRRLVTSEQFEHLPWRTKKCSECIIHINKS